MKTITLTLYSALLLSTSTAVFAANYLPNPREAQQALWKAPGVHMAQQEVRAQQQESAALRKGREEFTLGAEMARRTIETPPQEQFKEWSVNISRPLRLPYRAKADHQLGENKVNYAQANLGETVHETSRQLLSLWFEWLNQVAQVQLMEEQMQLVQSQNALVSQKVKLGDAARAEQVTMDATFAQTAAQLQQAEQGMRLTQGKLLAQFPDLTVPDYSTIQFPDPNGVQGTQAEWVKRILAHNHELHRARSETQLLNAEKNQFASRQSFDPEIGLRYGKDRAGEENVAAINLSLTLNGDARKHDTEAARIRANAARDNASLLEEKLIIEAKVNYQLAESSFAAWQQAHLAANSLQEAHRLAARAYELGEGHLNEVLLAKRNAVDGLLASRQMQIQALLDQTRLQLDAHQLWSLDKQP